jgi:translocator assembly and maintenance protein 41
LATESVSHSTPHSTPPPPPLHPNHNHIPHPHKPRSRVYPQPRIPTSPQHLSLPPTFGRNQLLPVADSTRALLESIVAEFDAPIRYAFAYGSGVFEQDGYQSKAEKPMLDFMFAVRHPAHWHSINMQQHPSHYSMHSRLFGSSYVSRVQEISPGIWFNAYVEMKGVVSTISELLASRPCDPPIYTHSTDCQVWRDHSG